MVSHGGSVKTTSEMKAYYSQVLGEVYDPLEESMRRSRVRVWVEESVAGLRACHNKVLRWTALAFSGEG